MWSPLGLTARRAVSLSSALMLTMLLPGGVIGQDQPAGPSASAEVEIAASAPGKFKLADTPKGTVGQPLGGVVAGGPGFIAVGGGSRSGLDQEALIWVSDDGLRWQSVPLFGDAAKGMIVDVAATPVGYIAVGSDFVPQGREYLTEALVWHSDDGLVWERVPSHESFLGSIMRDVAATPDGVVAVGCRSDLQCMTGRVWHSSDGLAWELTAELPLAAAATVAHDGSTTVVGGVDEVIDYGVGRAVLASSADGSTWTMTDPLADPQSGILDIASRDGAFLAVGSEWALGGDEPRSLLQSSPDGSAWTAITSRMFDGLEATAVGSSDELTIVAGTRNGAAKPSILWSQDLETFRKGAFAKKPARDGVRLTGVTIDHETGLAVVVGSNGYRPAIWVSKLK